MSLCYLAAEGAPPCAEKIRCERGHAVLICVPGANPVSLSSVAKPFRRFDNADVAQLVEHHLAKVRVAGSSPVIRSQSGIHSIPLGVVGWPRGEAAACKAVYTGSNPVPTSGDWRRGSALPSHGRGHWFDPSIAHGNLKRSGGCRFVTGVHAC